LGLANLVKVLWACSLTLQIAILAVMIGKRLYREFPAIFTYVLINSLQSPVVYLVYSVKGYGSWPAFWTGWISQSIVVIFRWMAVCELCHAILGQFRGIWGLTWRALAVLGASALMTGLLLGRHDFERLISTFDLGLELSMATVLVVFFLFAQYYKVQIESSLKSIGIAFCLYSCFRTLNDTVLQTLWRDYANTWILVDGIAYIATLVLLGGAVYVLRPPLERKIALLPQITYAQFTPEVNERLSALNQRLGQLLKSRETKRA